MRARLAVVAVAVIVAAALGHILNDEPPRRQGRQEVQRGSEPESSPFLGGSWRLGGSTRPLPLRDAPPADVALLADVARATGAPPSAAVQDLVARAAAGGSREELLAAIDRGLAGELTVRLLARRWVQGRSGDAPSAPQALPRPATGMVGRLAAVR